MRAQQRQAAADGGGGGAAGARSMRCARRRARGRRVVVRAIRDPARTGRQYAYED
jgi:hypothetical protein